ncbi:MAG: sugar ABC transporter permease, partial [Pseudonocardia sp.]|nr:sugar ABC transporter permease [Pseudonocardia sp.]
MVVTPQHTDPAAPPAPSELGRRRLADSDRALAWLFLSPAVVYIVALVGVPFVLALAFSLSDVTAGNPSFDFVGARNFLRAFQDPVFW